MSTNLSKVNNAICGLQAAIELLDEWKLNDDDPETGKVKAVDFMRDVTYDKFAAIRILEQIGLIKVGLTLDDKSHDKHMAVIL